MKKHSVTYSLVKALKNILTNILMIFLMLGAYVLWGIQKLLPGQWPERVKKFMTKGYLKIELACLMFLAILLELTRWILEIAQGKKQK